MQGLEMYVLCSLWIKRDGSHFICHDKEASRARGFGEVHLAFLVSHCHGLLRLLWEEEMDILFIYPNLCSQKKKASSCSISRIRVI